jgi:hypothetical protein
LENQSDCPLDFTEAYISRLQRFWTVAESRKKQMNLTNKCWAPVLLGVREELSPKEVRAKSVRTWFWVAVFIIVPFGLATWPLRRLYLMLKEKFDEQWERTVL